MECTLVSASDLEKKDLKKHVAAIRVSNTVGVLGRKIWNILLLNAYEDLLEKDTHVIPISVLSDVAGYNSHSYKTLETALKKLQTTLVQWDIGGGCEVKGMWAHNYVSAQMLGSFKMEDGLIEYYYPKFLPELLYNPDIYQRINLSQQKLFKSSYSLALWENCLRFIGVGSTGFSDIDEWKELLGAESKAYSQFKAFRQLILNPSIKEINKKSNITIELQTQKRGRKIIKMGFLIKEKNQQSLFSDRLDTLKSTPEYEDLLSYGIHKVQALEWIDKEGCQYIREKISLLEKQQKNSDVKNPSGWLSIAIKNNYKDSVKMAEEKAKKQAKKKRLEKQIIERKQAEEKALEEQKNKLSKEYREQEVEKFISTLTQKQRDDLLADIRGKYSSLQHLIDDLHSSIAISSIVDEIPNFKKKQKAYVQKNLKNNS